jgi:hypothetical protein
MALVMSTSPAAARSLTRDDVNVDPGEFLIASLDRAGALVLLPP